MPKKLFTFLQSGLLIGASLLGLVSLPASAQSTVELYPGQSAIFSIDYSNGGDAAAENALLRIYIGDKLDLDITSLTDQFGTNAPVSVCPTVIKNSGQTGVGFWGYMIEYRPRSAENPTGSCGGLSTPGPADLGVATDNLKGQFKFRAALKSTVTDPAGTLLEPTMNQGVMAKLVLGGPSGDVNSEIIIKLKESPLPASSAASSLAVSSAISSSAISSMAVSSANSSLIMSSAASSTAPVRSNLAKPDPNKTTGGGFEKNQPQPINSGMIFNPNPGKVGQQMVITTLGLKDSVTSENLENAPCETTLKGPGYQISLLSTVVNGDCRVTLPSDKAPLVATTYQAVTKVMGPNNINLFTLAENIRFEGSTTVTVRTGGPAALITGILSLSLLGGAMYFFARKQRMSIDKYTYK